MVRSLTLIAVVMVLTAQAELRITDSRGSVAVTKVSLDSLRDPASFRMDVDGDGKKDSVVLYFQQVGYNLVTFDHGEKVWISGFDAIENPPYVEFATAYVIGPHKPVMVIKFSTGVQMSDSLYIVDIVRTASGMKPITLLRCSASWGDAPTVVKPGFVEIQHFREWPMTRYLWDGETFIAKQVEGK